MPQSGEREAIVINYSAREPARPRYFANDHSRDTVVIDARIMPMHDVRGQQTSLDVEGFVLVDHEERAHRFQRSRRGRKASLPGNRRPGEGRHGRGRGFLQQPSDHALFRRNRQSRIEGQQLSGAICPCRCQRRDRPAIRGDAGGRAAFSAGGALQCLARAVAGAAGCAARAVRCARPSTATTSSWPTRSSTASGGDWSFEGYVFAHDPGHRWCWYPDLTAEEAIVFKTHDTEADVARLMPHVAFDDPLSPPDAAPRVSIEMRAIAYWWS